MEKATVIALLEKYFEAGTTVGEEKELAEFFRRQNDLDPDLAPYRELFGYFEQEAQVSAGADLEDRILRRIGLSGSPARSARTFHLGFIAAAASIGVIVASLFLLTPGERPGGDAAGGRVSGPGPSRAQVSPAMTSTTIRDTYDDPERALAAVRHALLIASAHLNEGRRSITGPK